MARDPRFSFEFKRQLVWDFLVGREGMRKPAPKIPCHMKLPSSSLGAARAETFAAFQSCPTTAPGAQRRQYNCASASSSPCGRKLRAMGSRTPYCENGLPVRPLRFSCGPPILS
jgi:hypothetical protein